MAGGGLCRCAEGWMSTPLHLAGHVGSACCRGYALTVLEPVLCWSATHWSWPKEYLWPGAALQFNLPWLYWVNFLCSPPVNWVATGTGLAGRGQGDGWAEKHCKGSEQRSRCPVICVTSFSGVLSTHVCYLEKTYYGPTAWLRHNFTHLVKLLCLAMRLFCFKLVWLEWIKPNFEGTINLKSYFKMPQPHVRSWSSLSSFSWFLFVQLWHQGSCNHSLGISLSKNEKKILSS